MGQGFDLVVTRANKSVWYKLSEASACSLAHHLFWCHPSSESQRSPRSLCSRARHQGVWRQPDKKQAISKSISFATLSRRAHRKELHLPKDILLFWRVCGIFFISFYYRFWIIRLLIFVWPCKWFAWSLQGEQGRTFSGCDRKSNPPVGRAALQACTGTEKP